MRNKTPYLTLCMIVRDSATTIHPCLESISPWVDEMIVVDTGSKDDTPLIARKYGAQVHFFPWCDDFSAARNESLRHARGSWIFWMDSDDTISASCGEKLGALARGQHHPSTLGYVVQVRCPSYQSPDEFTVVDHVKLFRNLPQLHFEFRIHEQLLPSIRRLGGNVEWTDIHVVHSGSDDSWEGRQKKYERDLRILALELKERPNHPFALFNFGMTYADMGEHQVSTEYLERCLKFSEPDESHVRKAYSLLIASLLELNEPEKAQKNCEHALQLFPRDVELRFRQGVLAHQAGRLAEAETGYLNAIYGDEERHFSSRDEAITGYKARHNLALVYRDAGRRDLAELQWRLAVADRPQYGVGWRSLGEELIRQGRLQSAAIVWERMRGNVDARDVALLECELAEAHGDVSAARTCLETALRQAHDEALEERLAQLLFERGPLGDAIEYFESLLQAQPDHAHHAQNLGILHLRAGQPKQALRVLEQAQEIRPDYRPTLLQIAEAHRLLGNHSAAERWQRRLDMASTK